MSGSRPNPAPLDAAALSREYRERLIRFCWGYVGRHDEAEDAVQEIFVKVLRAEEAPLNLTPWLFKVARNHCLNVLRSRRRRRDGAPLPSGISPAATLTGCLTRLLNAEQCEEVRRLLDDLPDAQQEVLRLRYADGLSRSEIAEILDLPESVVKSRLYEALKKLREHVGRPGGEGEAAN